MTVLALQTVLCIKTANCSACGCVIGMEESFYDHRLADHKTFYCPNGHSQYFLAKSDRDRLDEEVSRHRNTIARLNEEKVEREKLEKKLKRVGRGVCPECKRTFPNLAAHMKCKHGK